MNHPDFSLFKKSISLAQYAASLGYEINKKKSTRSSLAMVHGTNGDKIIISKKGESWVYFSVHDDSDNGTIIDFIKNRSQKSLPEIGEELSKWSNITTELPVSHIPDVKEQVYDRSRIQRAFTWLKPIGSHPYLINDRKIPAAILNHPRFKGKIFEDRYGNAVFPHQDGQGVCGLELKNHDKGVFMRGSEKALWLGRTDPADSRLVLAESGIDALSHFALFQPENTAYAAVSGGMRDKQFDFLLEVIRNMPYLESIILAVDNDEGGQKIAKRIEGTIAGKFTGQIKRHVPEQAGLDWNNVLKKASDRSPRAPTLQP